MPSSESSLSLLVIVVAGLLVVGVLDQENTSRTAAGQAYKAKMSKPASSGGVAVPGSVPPLPGARASPASSRMARQSAGTGLSKESQQVKKLSGDLRGLAARYSRAAPSEKGTLMPQLRSLAQQRRQAMAALIKKNPAEAVKAALPDSVRQALPSDLQPLVEARTFLRGKLEILHADDFANKRSWNEYFIVGPGDMRIALYFAKTPPSIRPETQTQARGVYLDGAMAVEEAESPEQEGSSMAQATADIVGERRVAVILFNFINDQSQPFTVEEARTEVFGTGVGSVKDYFEEVSYQQLIITSKYDPQGDVYGWVTIPFTNENCGINYGFWSDAALAALGEPLASGGYDDYIFIFPGPDTCPWGGLSNMRDRVWINGYVSTFVIGHELGHNFGAGHADFLLCTNGGIPVPIGPTCEGSEYGDRFDIMGSGLHHSSSNSKWLFGWYSRGSVHEVRTPGTYSLVPFETDQPGNKLLRIPRAVSIRGVQNLYLEFRQPYGFDNFGVSDPVVNGVSIRLGNDYLSAAPTYLLDSTPGDHDYLNAPFGQGTVLDDLDSGTNVLVNSASDQNAIVSITLACVRRAPTFALLADYSVFNTAGQPLTVDIRIANGDSVGCASSDFSLSASLPAGWQQTPAFSPVTLPPLLPAVFPITLLPPATVPDGVYSYTLDLSQVGFAGGATASGEILIDTQAPVVSWLWPADGAVLPTAGIVPIGATASDEDLLMKIEFQLNSNHLSECQYYSGNQRTCTYDWDVSGLPAGTYTLEALATDRAGNVGRSTIRVTKGIMWTPIGRQPPVFNEP